MSTRRDFCLMQQIEREVNMLCANPECCSASFDQPGGSLWLLELELDPAHKANGDDNGFPICTMPTKYFWLCIDCSQKYVLSRWLRSGVVLKPRKPGERYAPAKQGRQAASKPFIRIHASIGLEDEFEETV